MTPVCTASHNFFYYFFGVSKRVGISLMSDV